MLVLIPSKIKITDLKDIYESKLSVTINRKCKDDVDRASNIISKILTSNKSVYGVNTGFGKLANVKINLQDTKQLQKNLILSHCCGVGEYLKSDIVRLMMVLKIISLSRGASGIRWNVITTLEQMINKNIIPLIPIQGSVGASGDLAPLAHMSYALIGEGKVKYKGKITSVKSAFAKENIEAIILEAKEGLALINGTQFSTACALVGLFEAWNNLDNSIIIACMSQEASMGSTQPLSKEIHALRGHKGQIDVASKMRKILSGSEIRKSHLKNDTRVQDPYCIRCFPQVAGACLDQLRMVAKTLEIEANAVTDNPIVVTNREQVISGGNFHAQCVAFAADQLALAISEIGSIAQRRIALLVDPNLNHNLPPFLSPKAGINSGFMIAEVTSAALMSENKHLANPCSTDSTPTSANQEDHVSMAAHGARRLLRMNENLSHLLSIELLCAAQGIEFRAPLQTSVGLQSVIVSLRKKVKTLKQDRFMAHDLLVVKNLCTSNSLRKSIKNYQELSFI